MIKYLRELQDSRYPGKWYRVGRTVFIFASPDDECFIHCIPDDLVLAVHNSIIRCGSINADLTRRLEATGQNSVKLNGLLSAQIRALELLGGGS